MPRIITSDMRGPEFCYRNTVCDNNISNTFWMTECEWKFFFSDHIYFAELLFRMQLPSYYVVL